MQAFQVMNVKWFRRPFIKMNWWNTWEWKLINSEAKTFASCVCFLFPIFTQLYLSNRKGDMECDVFFKWAIEERTVCLPYSHQMVRGCCTCYFNYYLKLSDAFLPWFQSLIHQPCIPLRRVICPQDHSFLLPNTDIMVKHPKNFIWNKNLISDQRTMNDLMLEKHKISLVFSLFYNNKQGWNHTWSSGATWPVTH